MTRPHVAAGDATVDVTDMDDALVIDFINQSVLGAETRGEVTWIIKRGKHIAVIVPVCCADKIQPHGVHER
jgi:hypothetical protein